MFKIKLMVLTAVLSALLLLSLTVFAEAEAGVKVNSDGITVSGKLDGADRQYIVAVFSAGSESGLNDDNIEGILVGLSQGVADESGSFEAVIPLGFSIASGDYVAEISTSGNFESVLKLEFYYMSRADIIQMTGKFNSASTATDLQTLTEEYSSKLNVDFDGVYKSRVSDDDVYRRMLAIKNKADFADNVAVKAAFDEACVMSAVENSATFEAYAELLTVHSDILGVDISNLSEEEISATASILFKNDYELACDLAGAFDEAVCAAMFNLASREEAEALIEKYKNHIDLPSQYSKSGASAVEKRLALYKKIENETDFETYDDISDFIDDFYDNYDDGNKGGSLGGGSYGGSGKTTAVVQITPPSVPVSEPVQSGTSQLTPATNFKDLAGFEWALEAIEALANSKVILGVSENSYEPARSITREEFVKMAVIAFDIPMEGSAEFTDVPHDAWYRPYVMSACNSGIVEGMGDGSFGTGRGITRQEMAVIMNRIISIKGIEAAKDGALEFDDSQNIALWAEDAVNVLTANKILNGVSRTHFAPGEGVNRAMAAKAVYGLGEFIHKQEGADK